MKKNNVYGINLAKLKWQIFYMLVFIMLLVMLLVQRRQNLRSAERNQRLDVATDIFCITEVCLNDDCLEVPGTPVEGKVLIQGDYDNKHVKHILVLTYPGHRCGNKGEQN